MRSLQAQNPGVHSRLRVQRQSNTLEKDPRTRVKALRMAVKPARLSMHGVMALEDRA